MVLKRIDRYGPDLAGLVQADRLNGLDSGVPNRKVHGLLDRLTVDQAFGNFRVVDRHAAQACLSGLWLYHDFLDQSHRISQNLDTAEGCFWHAIMHRREGDYGNSKYWFRRVGPHAIYEPLQSFAAELCADADVDESAFFLVEQPRWDPYSFVDLCETECRQPSPLEQICMQIQQGEWELLFEYCFRKATGI